MSSLLSNHTLLLPPTLPFLKPKRPLLSLSHSLSFHSLPRLHSLSSFPPPRSTNTPPSSSVPDDEWGEDDDEPTEPTKFSDPDPPIREDEDEWGPEEETTTTTEPDPPSNETQVEDETVKQDDDNDNDNVMLSDLKRCLVDTVYGSDLGIRASAEIRAEVVELVAQLEAANPTVNPYEVPELLDGNWVLLYTAFSELLPLLAVGTLPLLKVEKITQVIDSGNRIVDNSTTLSSPFATLTFSATAAFEVRTPTRIQVKFKEATFKPPEIKSRFDLPESVDLFGQTVALSPVQQLLNPLQDVAANISRSLYGLPPLKIPIPGERTESWLVTTYLDEDFRISRGDGGLFVLVREGSSLLN